MNDNQYSRQNETEDLEIASPLFRFFISYRKKLLPGIFLFEDIGQLIKAA